MAVQFASCSGKPLADIKCKEGYSYQRVHPPGQSDAVLGCFRDPWTSWDAGSSACTGGVGWAPDGGVGCVDANLVPDTQHTVACPLNQGTYNTPHYDCMQDNDGKPLWTNCPYKTPYDPNVLWLSNSAYCGVTTPVVNST